MICPACQHNNSRVVDTRTSKADVGAVRRRIECKHCGMRFSSIEIVVGAQLPKGIHAPDNWADEVWNSLITVALQRATRNALLHEIGKRMDNAA